ncbi:MAG: tail fiber domain-containing protein, partial [Bacteroidetes bacterium]|nr:tail fiber domain-containing protein [Bacteroidota bacterium]
SDIRLKENINDSKLGLDFILNLHPVTYNYKDEEQRDILYTGLIAQEVDAAAKKENVDFSGVDKNGEYWGIRYGDLTVPLVKGMQELNAELKISNEKLGIENANRQLAIDDLQNENANQQMAIDNLKNEISEMRSCLATLCNNQQKADQNNSTSIPQLSISPNPTSDIATITISSNDKMQNLVVKIVDASGKIIRTYNATSVSSSFEFNTSSLSKGTYMVQLFNQNELLKTEKLIIQ